MSVEHALVITLLLVLLRFEISWVDTQLKTALTVSLIYKLFKKYVSYSFD